MRTLWAYVPGYVRCSEPGVAEGTDPARVSVIVDSESGAAAPSGREGLADVPVSWELIVFRPASGARVKTITRWPRRGALQDRTLASAHADGAVLAFVRRLDAVTVAWIQEALERLQGRPDTALVRRVQDTSAEADDPGAFVVRRDVWDALGGYPPGHSALSPRCAEIELTQRIRRLGYSVEPAPQGAGHGIPKPGPRCPIDGPIVLYTAITDAYDRLRALDPRRVEPARRIAFLDEATRAAAPATRGWEIRDAAVDETDPIRGAKKYKVRPELFFPEAEYSLWIDGNVTPVHPFDVRRLIELYLAGADLCVFRHHARSCVYDEAEACKVRRLDSAALVDGQMERYREDGFPPNYGLHEMVVVLRRHTDEVKRFDRLWWDEICRGSRRDQLSFDYVRWKTGLPVAEFPLTIQERNGLFVKEAHPRRWPPSLVVGSLVRAALRRVKGVHITIAASRPSRGESRSE